MAEEV